MIKIKRYAKNFQTTSNTSNNVGYNLVDIDEQHKKSQTKSAPETIEQFYERLEQDTNNMLNNGWRLIHVFPMDKYIIHYYEHE